MSGLRTLVSSTTEGKRSSFSHSFTAASVDAGGGSLGVEVDRLFRWCCSLATDGGSKASWSGLVLPVMPGNLSVISTDGLLIGSASV